MQDQQESKDEAQYVERITRTNHSDFYHNVKLYGINVVELFGVTAGAVTMFVILTILSTNGAYMPWWVRLSPLAIGGVILWILKKANKQDEPVFLLSFISFHFRQPKKIVVKDPQRYDRAIQETSEHSKRRK